MNKLFRKMLIACMAVLISMTNVVPALAETISVSTQTGQADYTMDSDLTVRVGEAKELTVTEVSSNKDFLYNIEWGTSQAAYISTDCSGGFGSYWGQPGKCKVTGVAAGKAYVIATVKVYTNDESKTLVDKIKLTCTVTITDASASETNDTQPEAAQPEAAQPEETQPEEAQPEAAQPEAAQSEATQSETVALTSITMNAASKTLTAGNTAQLSVSYNPSNTTVNKTVTWSSSNSSIAKVSSTGKVTAVKAGTVTITAVCNGKKATCKITVKARTVALTSIKMSAESKTLTAGNTAYLGISYNPSNTTVNRKVTWSSSNSSVATVSSAGKVTAVKAGTATITAVCNGKKATCKITVKAKTVALISIKMNAASKTLTAGNTAQLSVSYNPSNTTVSKTVFWSSSDYSVATVSSTGKVTAIKGGTAVITAKVGNKTTTCKIKVNAAPASYKNVSDAYSILNTFRTTKANQWYWNASNTGKVTTYGLKALTRDATLESVAKLRAKEAWSMYYEKGLLTHDRPDGSSCFTAYPANMTHRGENLHYWNASSSSVIQDPYLGWAETNSKYSGQGHRRNMLDSGFTKVGIACYVKDGKACWAMCLGN